MTTDYRPRYQNGRPYPSPNGPRMLWVHVPQANWATGEHCARYMEARPTEYIWPRSADVRAGFVERHDKDFERRGGKFNGCEAAVEWSLGSGLYWPCPWPALFNGMCWKHGGWREFEVGNVRQRITVNLDDEEECGKPEAQVSISLGEVTLDGMTAKFARLKRAAQAMGAPGDALVRIDTYSKVTTVVIKWNP